ncbi:MAG: hypothetical protein J6Q17_00330, partial [Clostridia bacterium]|nr:hypothetical protein [Clostridia bacterium]
MRLKTISILLLSALLFTSCAVVLREAGSPDLSPSPEELPDPPAVTVSAPEEDPVPDTPETDPPETRPPDPPAPEPEPQPLPPDPPAPEPQPLPPDPPAPEP